MESTSTLLCMYYIFTLRALKYPKEKCLFMGMIYRNVALSLNRSVLYLSLHNEVSLFENVFVST